MSLELLSIIVTLCTGVTAVEGVNGSFSKLQKTEAYQKECILFYSDCVKAKQPMNPNESAVDLISCVQSRVIKE